MAEIASPQPKRSRSNRMLRVFYLVAGVLVVAAFAFKVFQPIQVVPRIRLAPGFLFTDQNGQRLTNEDLRGKFVLYNFVYTRCSSDCRALNETMRAVQTRLNEVELGEIEVAFVSVSFDPAYDTTERLAAYAAAQNADPARWRFATSANESLLKTIIGSGFEVFYEQQADGSYQFDPVFILVDGWGIIRGIYKYQTMAPEADRILRHMNVMANEARNSQGAARLAYEAAHLFLCYTP